MNQWKFRSVYGRTFLLNFFFNGGSLSGDELLRQLTHQVHPRRGRACRRQGPGGVPGCWRGQQSPLLPLERRAKGRRRRLGFGGAGDVCEPCLSKSRSVAVFFCATHGLKSQRNAFSNSSVTPGAKKRTFVTTEGVAFGLESIERCLVRDQKRSARKTKQAHASSGSAEQVGEDESGPCKGRL